MRKVEDVKVEISLGCSGREIVEFRILRGVSRAKSKITTLHQESGLWPYGKTVHADSHGIRPWMEKGPKKALWYSRIMSSEVKNSPLQQAGSQAKVSGWFHELTRSSWQNSSIKRRDTVWICRNDVRKAKIHLKLNFVGGVRGSKRTSHSTQFAKED